MKLTSFLRFISNLIRKQELFLKNQCSPIDGGVSERVFKLIYSIIS